MPTPYLKKVGHRTKYRMPFWYVLFCLIVSILGNVDCVKIFYKISQKCLVGSDGTLRCMSKAIFT